MSASAAKQPPMILAAALAVLAGCVAPRRAAEIELDSTETFEVTPQNGVWDAEYGRTDDPANCSFSFRVARLRDGIRVAVSVRDDKVCTDSAPPGEAGAKVWDDDNVECFFDGDNDGAKDSRAGVGPVCGGEYAMTAAGAAQSDFSCRPGSFGRLWTGTVSRRETEGGGTVLDYDLRFSWQCLGLAAAPADGEDVTFGFNICVHDDDDGGRADRALYWRGNPVMPYRDESGFGKITLKGTGK